MKSPAVLLGKSNAAHATTQVITRSGAGLKGQTFATTSAGVIGMDASTAKGGHGMFGHSIHGADRVEHRHRDHPEPGGRGLHRRRPGRGRLVHITLSKNVASAVKVGWFILD